MDEQKLKDLSIIYLGEFKGQSQIVNAPLPHWFVNTLLTHTRLEKSKVSSSALQKDFPYDMTLSKSKIRPYLIKKKSKTRHSQKKKNSW